jgi:hypothetical protein
VSWENEVRGRHGSLCLRSLDCTRLSQGTVDVFVKRSSITNLDRGPRGGEKKMHHEELLAHSQIQNPKESTWFVIGPG